MGCPLKHVFVVLMDFKVSSCILDSKLDQKL